MGPLVKLLKSPSLSALERGVLRGVCYATKVTRQGMPWAICAFGLVNRPPQWGWAHIWLKKYAAWLNSLPSAERSAVDFLMPDFVRLPSGKYTIYARPVPYYKALSLYRRALRQYNPRAGRAVCLTPQAAAEYTLHIKVFTTALAAQLNLSSEERSSLGHHRTDSAQNSVRLYSRDDVWLALKAQLAIID